MRHLPKTQQNPNVLVGLDTSDDAGVYKMSDDTAMIQTVDFFTPIVDDPYMFGQIAAANSLSDVYAMGGKPVTVLNIVGFPVQKLDMSILAEILKGASEKVTEAGAVVAGGHSIDDNEPKFGLSVTGTVHPERYWTNSDARPGDALLLTKPVGVGIQTTAIKKNALTDSQLQNVMHVMATLNKTAAEVLGSYDVHACTDVTGFGLLGHAHEMACGASAGIRIQAGDVPVLDGTRTLAEDGYIPGGSKDNRAWLGEDVRFDDAVDEITRSILCDAVTSGGLLASLPADQAEKAAETLRKAGVADAAVIGRVQSESPGCIQVDA